MNHATNVAAPRITLLSTIAALFFSSACGDTADSDQGVLRRDSASTEIVESRRPRWSAGQEWRVADSAFISIDGPFSLEADHEPGFLDGPLLLDNRLLVVTDGGSFSLRLFDTAGRMVRHVGRKGQGPGEFEHMTSLFRLAHDTLVVFDINEHRLSVLTDSGTFVRHQIVSFGEPRAMFADGRYVTHSAMATAGGFSAEAPPAGTQSMALSIASIDGTNRRSLGTFRQGVMVDAAVGPMNLTFGPEHIEAARGSLYYAGYSSSFRIDVYDARGTFRTSIRRAWTAIPSTLRHLAHARATGWANLIASVGAHGMPPEVEQRMHAVFASMVAADSFPAFDKILVDADENLWVRAYRIPDDGTPKTANLTEPTFESWSVFDRDGVWLGNVKMPNGLLVRDIGRDYVSGLTGGDAEPTRIRVYRLAKSPAR